MQATQLPIPLMGFGVFFLFVLVFMVVSYWVSPADIDASREPGEDEEGTSTRSLEIILMTLLFFYHTLSMSGEVAIGSE